MEATEVGNRDSKFSGVGTLLSEIRGRIFCVGSTVNETYKEESTFCLDK